MSNFSLIDVLRGALRLASARNYDVSAYDGLDGVEIPENFIYEQYNMNSAYIQGRIQMERDNPVISSNGNPIQLIQDLMNSGKGETPTTRVLMSDILYKSDESDPRYRIPCLFYFTRGYQGATTIEDVREFSNIMFKHRIQNGVFITVSQLTPSAQASLDQIKNPDNSVYHFTDDEIISDPTAHIYNSQIRCLSQEEQTEFLTSNHLKPINLPKAHTDDPTVKYVGVEVGRVIEYTTRSFIPATMAPISITHRVVRPAGNKKKRPPARKK